MAARGTNMSLASELLQLIDEEEYIQTIPPFEEDDYLNKNEVCSLKKMTSSKLWVDNRKFVTRQNTPITSGLFEMIGSSVSKSASDTKAEACDYLLDPDNKNLRSVIKNSLKGMELSYSKWITKLSEVHPPCDSVVLYLLCKTFKRHAVVLTSSKIWSTFKAGNRTPLDMFVKADFVLLWLGDNRFAEVKPLRTATNTLGSLVEWQQLTDSIHVVHDKRQKEKKARKPRQPKQPRQPEQTLETDSPAVSTPRKGRKRESKVQIDYKSMHNEGLTARSPKQHKRLLRASGPSESRIESQRMITRELLQKQTIAKGYDTTAKIVGTCIKTEKLDDKSAVKLKIKTEMKQKPDEPEQNVQKRIKLEASEIHMVHRKNPADSNKTWRYIHPSGSPCGRRHCLRGNLRSDELPDLITTTTTTTDTAKTSSEPIVSTPPAADQSVGKTLGKESVFHTETTRTVSTPHSTDQAVGIREATVDVSTVSTTRTPTKEGIPSESTNTTTTTALSIELPQVLVSTPQTDPTAITTGGSVLPNVTRVHDKPTVDVTREADIQTAQTLLELHETLGLPENNLMDAYDNSEIMPVDAPQVPDYSDSYPLATLNDNDTDATVEYADENEPANKDTEYVTANPAPPNDGDQSPPGRFKMRHHGIRRHVSSPTTKPKKFHCIYCSTTTDSKRELNTHHRSRHGIMRCVDCDKTFPTPDSLQRHRYIHQQEHEHYKCEICDYITAFESDMQRHKIQHVDERMWDCTGSNCERSFKRKSDMISHAKTHTNEDQRCPAQGCDYSNKDPRNLKRHMKRHSNMKPLKCPMCPERFKHYQQLKRHKENHP